jgi:hypothetical protein
LLHLHHQKLFVDHLFHQYYLEKEIQEDYFLFHLVLQLLQLDLFHHLRLLNHQNYLYEQV